MRAPHRRLLGHQLADTLQSFREDARPAIQERVHALRFDGFLAEGLMLRPPRVVGRDLDDGPLALEPLNDHHQEAVIVDDCRPVVRVGVTERSARREALRLDDRNDRVDDGVLLAWAECAP
jgi:hypothetical protein